MLCIAAYATGSELFDAHTYAALYMFTVSRKSRCGVLKQNTFTLQNKYELVLTVQRNVHKCITLNYSSPKLNRIVLNLLEVHS